MRVITLLALMLSVGGQAQSTSPTPATIPAGIGTPAANSQPCGIGQASPTTASVFIQREITTGNASWKCVLSADGITYSWIAPFISPFIGTGTTATITPPTIVGCTTGTASVTGATTAMAAIASPIGSPGTGQINSTASVTSAGIVTVTLCLPLTLVYTATPVAYKVLVF